MVKRRPGLLHMIGLALAIVLVPATLVSGAGVLADIKQRGTLKLCTADSPYIQKDPKTGNWVGYDADLADMYAKQLGVKVQWVDSSWGNIIPTTLAKKCDIAWGVFFYRPEREKTIDQTKPIHNTGLLVVVRADDNRFKSYQDLNKKGIVFSQLADIGETEAKKNFPNATVRVIQSDQVNAQSLEVVAGRADANLTDALLAYDLVKKNAGVKIVSGPIIRRSNMVFILRKDSKDLLASVNKFITDVDANGTLKTFGQKYGIPPGFK